MAKMRWRWPRPFRGRHNAAHRVHPPIETRDILHEQDQVADRKQTVLERFATCRYPHTTNNPKDVSRVTTGSKNVHIVLTRSVGLQHAVVRQAKSFGLAPFLRERLDNPNAGNRVGQHACHFAPCPGAQGKTSPQSASHKMDQKCNDRQGEQRCQSKLRIERTQNCRHQQER